MAGSETGAPLGVPRSPFEEMASKQSAEGGPLSYPSLPGGRTVPSQVLRYKVFGGGVGSSKFKNRRVCVAEA